MLKLGAVWIPAFFAKHVSWQIGPGLNIDNYSFDPCISGGSFACLHCLLLLRQLIGKYVVSAYFGLRGYAWLNSRYIMK